MTGRCGLVLLLFAMPCVAACRDTPRARAAELQKIAAARKQDLALRLATVDPNSDKAMPLAMWIMTPQLREISGLALTSRGTVLTHDDNSGRVSEIDPKTGILLKAFSLVGNQKEDFEAIAIAGNDIYLMASDGKLFRFREGADGQQVQFMLFDTGLRKQCEFESLTYEADSTRLLMACKRQLATQSRDVHGPACAAPASDRIQQVEELQAFRHDHRSVHAELRDHRIPRKGASDPDARR